MESRNVFTAVIGIALLIITGLIYFQLGKVAKSLEDLECTCEEPEPDDPTPGPIITVGPGSGGQVAWTWGTDSTPNFNNPSLRIQPEAVGTTAFIRGVVEDGTVSQDVTRWEVKVDDRVISAEEINGEVQFFVLDQSTGVSNKVQPCDSSETCTGFPPEFEGAFNGLALYSAVFPGGAANGDLASSRASSP